MNYLTDEELQNLIDSAEQDEIQAPPELMGKVLECIEKEKGVQISKKSIEKRRMEYRLYTVKVVLAMAACIALCILSKATDTGRMEHADEIYSRNRVYKTKQEVMEENKTLYQTIKETDFFTSLGIVEE